ncbi:MAG: hypothetical protein ABSC87_04010 [Halobacteriota archaeon]|jgi:hypothetical protein
MDENDIEEMLKDYDYISFEQIGSENWSVYHLKDSAIIKLKAVPLKLLKRGNNIILSPMLVQTAFVPRGHRGTPSETPFPTTPEGWEDELTQINIGFDIINEPWNEYRIDSGGTFSLKAVAIEFASTKLYDPQREPVYIINSQILTKKSPMI